MAYPPSGKHAGSVTSRKPSRSQFHASLEEVATLENMLFAFQCARKGKTKRAVVQKYQANLGVNLLDLQKRILNGTYKPRPCHEFEIFCTAGQKRRTISAPVFEDTVVQHLLYQLVYPKIDESFIFDSYGCRRGKGTHKAADRLQYFMRKAPAGAYTLQLDVRKYYYRINHEPLQAMLSRFVADSRIVDLLMAFVGDGAVGLNVGCLLSQLYGMVYLDGFDHYFKRTLGVKYYVRYVDDIVMVVDSKSRALELREAAVGYLADIGLELSKWRTQPLEKGVNFAGFRTWTHKRLIRKRSLHNFNRKLKSRNMESLVSILGHAKYTASYGYFLDCITDEFAADEYKLLPVGLQKDLGERICGLT